MSRFQFYKDESKRNFSGSNDMRQRRLDASARLRKQYREDTAMEHRNLSTIHDSEDFDIELAVQIGRDGLNNYIMQSANFGSPIEQLKAIRKIRGWLSSGNIEIIKALIEIKVLWALVECLKHDEFIELQGEAISAITNITSAWAHTEAVVAADAVPVLLHLTGSPETNVRQQAATSLANILACGSEYRNIVLEHGGLPLLLGQIKPSTPDKILLPVSRALLHICCYNDLPIPTAVIPQILDTLAPMVHHSDTQIQVYTVRSINCFVDKMGGHVRTVIETGVLPKLIEFMGQPDYRLMMLALRSVYNITDSTDENRQCVLDVGVLAHYPVLFHNHHDEARLESCGIIANIAAGTVAQVQAIIDANLLEPIIKMLDRSVNFRLRKRAVSVVTNIAHSGTAEQVYRMIEQNVLEAFAGFVDCHDTKLVCRLGKAINDMFLKFKGQGMAAQFIDAVEQSGVMHTVQTLQQRQPDNSIICEFLDDNDNKMLVPVQVHQFDSDDVEMDEGN